MVLRKRGFVALMPNSLPAIISNAARNYWAVSCFGSSYGLMD